MMRSNPCSTCSHGGGQSNPTKLTGQLKTFLRPWSYNFKPLIKTGQLKTFLRPRSYNFKPLIKTGQLKTFLRPRSTFRWVFSINVWSFGLEYDQISKKILRDLTQKSGHSSSNTQIGEIISAFCTFPLWRNNLTNLDTGERATRFLHKIS